MRSEDYNKIEEKDTLLYLQVDNQVILLLYSIIYKFIFHSIFHIFDVVFILL
jgi:hypothetical protein